MDVSVSETMDQKTYLRKFRGATAPLVLPGSPYEKTLDYKSKLTHSENAQKMRCNANHRDIDCATHCKPETKKTEDSSNACVC